MSYVEDNRTKVSAKKFKQGRRVWLRSDHEGSFLMTVMEAARDPAANAWSYRLQDSTGTDFGWVTEKKLTAARPDSNSGASGNLSTGQSRTNIRPEPEEPHNQVPESVTNVNMKPEDTGISTATEKTADDKSL